MDAEKRHQLKTNELAEALGKIRDFGSDPQTRYWLLGLVILVVAVVGYRWWAGRQQRQSISAWAALAQVGGGPERDVDAIGDELRALIADAPDALFAVNARVRLAILLCRQAEEDTGRSKELLTQAVEVLRQVVDDPVAPPALVAAAAFSLGTSCESLRDFDGATAAYRRITDEPRFAGSPFTDLAARRLETLGELSVPVHFEPGMPPPEPEPEADVESDPEPELEPEEWLPATQPAVPPAAATPESSPAPPEPEGGATAQADPPATQPTTQPAPDAPGPDSP